MTFEGSPEFDAFRAVRREQCARTPSGRPAYEMFTQGGCHALAYAVQERAGGNLVVVTPRSDPYSMVHVGVMKDGIVTDADGHSQSGYWEQVWAMRAGHEAMLRYTTREEIDTRIKPYDVPDSALMVLAAPFADALVAARNVDPNAWRSLLPAGSMSHIGPDSRREDAAAYRDALATGDEYGFPPAVVMPALNPPGVRPAAMAAMAAMAGRSRF